MSFLPSTINLLAYLISAHVFLICIGYVLVKKKLIWMGWLLFVASILFVYYICATENPVFKMLAIVSFMFICIKIITASESYKKNQFSLSVLQWIAFAIGWAGMRAQLFESLGRKPLPGAWSMIVFGISRMMMGILVILLAKQVLLLNVSKQVLFFVVTALLLIGYSLVLHFGILSCTAGFWKLFGVRTYFLFKSPMLSTSLTEFWSKRWNIAFSEMTSIAIYRPLKNKIGPVPLLMISFLFSGLLHEIAISLPVGRGFGFPLLYFTIQGAVVLLEKLLSESNISILRNKITARLWVYFWIIVPIPLLFHIYFIKEIVWPIAGLTIP